MITKSIARLVNLALQDDGIILEVKFYYDTDAGNLGGHWSHIVRRTIPHDTPGIAEIMAASRAWLLPFEKSTWEHFPTLADIRIYHVDVTKYGHGGDWGWAADYDRIDKDGNVVSGFNGEIIFQVRAGRYYWNGEEEGTNAEFDALGKLMWNWGENWVNKNILGGMKGDGKD